MIIKNYSDFQTALSSIRSADIIAFDTETDGLNVRSNMVIGIGICTDGMKTFYLPTVKWSNGHKVILETRQYANALLEALKGKKLIAHNSYFDAEMILNNFQVDLWDSLYLDTIMLVHTCCETGPFGLKQIAKKLWGADELAEQEAMVASIKANGGTGKHEIYKADYELIGTYCEQDCALTMRLMQHYLPILKSEGLEDLFFKTEVMPLYRLVTRSLQSGGIPLDIPLLQKTKAEIEVDIAKLEDEIQTAISDFTSTKFKEYYLDKEFKVSKTGEFVQTLLSITEAKLPKTKTGKFKLGKKELEGLKGLLVGDFIAGVATLPKELIEQVQAALFEHSNQKYMFNLSSKHHLKRLFFNHLKEKAISFTDKGAPQVDDLFLTKMAEKYDWVAKLQTYNKLNKIHGTYIVRFLEEQEDGKFYASYKQHGTVTGRYSGDLQQLPRKQEDNDVTSKYVNALRPALIAGPGFKLVGADYAQLEITVFADDANEPSLLKMIREKEDFYSRVAIDIFNLSTKYSASKSADNFLKKLNPDLRQRMKAVALGIRYGLESFKLHHDLKISQEEAEQIIQNYFKAYPNLKTRMDDLLDSVKLQGFVTSKAGRKRRLPEVRDFVKVHGDEMLNALNLWQKFNETNKYQEMRTLRKSIHNKLNASLNFPIQSMAASIVNRASIKIMEDFKEQGLQSYIVCQVHDEIVCRVPEQELDIVTKIMQNRMENTTKLQVPLEAKPEIGDNYGQIK